MELTRGQTPESVKHSYDLCFAVVPDWLGHHGAQAPGMENRGAKGLASIWMGQHAGFPGEGGKAQGVFKSGALERFGKQGGSPQTVWSDIGKLRSDVFTEAKRNDT